jgi:hypothetical protein
MATICENTTTFIRSFFNGVKIPLFYYNKLEESSSIIGQIQIDNIYTTLALIENRYKTDKINFYMKTNVQKCVKWCIKNQMEYNPNVMFIENAEKNIFIPMKI